MFEIIFYAKFSTLISWVSMFKKGVYHFYLYLFVKNNNNIGTAVQKHSLRQFKNTNFLTRIENWPWNVITYSVNWFFVRPF